MIKLKRTGSKNSSESARPESKAETTGSAPSAGVQTRPLKAVILELRQALDTTIQGWSRSIELRGKEPEGHTQHISELVLKMGRTYDMGEEELRDLRWGVLLHDLGKLGIPDEILNKPGPLSELEWETVRRHPVIAYELLLPIDYLKKAMEIPYCHHEWWDGSGYPNGLKGEDIPLAARLFSVVDVWDALISERPYRAAWPREKARDYIETMAGISLDPQAVKAFLLILDE